MVQQLEVGRMDLDQTRLVELDEAPLEAGAVRLSIDNFALTANNVTYGAFGDQMRYWDFFPATEKGWGIIPVWGHATVVESQCPEIQAGERVYGYLPMANELIVYPGKITPNGFLDTAEHRQPMAAIYSQYTRLNADPAHNPDQESERALFQPLFMTSFLIEDTFRRAKWYEAETLIITSASSKTALALAHVARASSPDVERIGLTSSGNKAFVETTGLYDQVLTYDAVDSIAVDGKAVSVDFAGNGQLLSALHNHLTHQLAYSMLVGVTHVSERGGADALPGPEPILFFAPTAAGDIIAELGPQGFQMAMAARWAEFVPDAVHWVHSEPVDGAEAIADAWRDSVAGNVAANRGLVCRF